MQSTINTIPSIDHCIAKKSSGTSYSGTTYIKMKSQQTHQKDVCSNNLYSKHPTNSYNKSIVVDNTKSLLLYSQYIDILLKDDKLD